MQEKKQNKSPIKQRILQYAESLGISKRDFYLRIGVSRGTLESNTGITEDVMAKFIAEFPNVSLEWLILGEGDIEINKYQTSLPSENILTEQAGSSNIEVFLKDMVLEKDKKIEEQAEFIGSLKQEIKQLKNTATSVSGGAEDASSAAVG